MASRLPAEDIAGLQTLLQGSPYRGIAGNPRLFPKLGIADFVRFFPAVAGVRIAEKDAAALRSFLAERGIVIMIRAGVTRLVTHLDVSAADVDKTVAAFKQFYRSS